MGKNERKTILVVDDTPANLRLLVGILAEKGYRVRPAPSGRHALATVQKEKPDLILLDIMMPDPDGFEVCRRLKADQHTRDIPIIFISALNEVFDKMTAFSIGGVDFITKPFQMEEVLARVHTHLSLESMRQQLQAQNCQLQQQNRDLDAFAHTVAHDLKIPLAKLLTSLSLIKEYGVDLDDELQEILALGIQSTYKMSEIIDELLLQASVRKEEVKLVKIDMAAVVTQALDRLSQMIDTYQPELILPDTWPQVYGQATWLEEVWVNFLSNGLKYGGCPPRLELGSTVTPTGYTRFWVQDNGPGLDEAAQANLFTEFARLDKSHAEGYGLGLSITRRILEKLGGRVGVESVPGQGSTFYFLLPTCSNDQS